MILSGKKKSESYQGKMAVKDRLKELQENSKYYKEGDFEEVEMKPLNPKSKSNFNEFLQSAEEIALGLSEIEKNVGEMRTMQKRILTEPSKDERDKFNAEHSNLLDINKGLGGKVQRLIKNEIESNNKLESKSGMNSNQLAELRLRKTQIATQANRYLEIWSEYSTLQVRRVELTKNHSFPFYRSSSERRLKMRLLKILKLRPLILPPRRLTRDLTKETFQSSAQR